MREGSRGKAWRCPRSSVSALRGGWTPWRWLRAPRGSAGGEAPQHTHRRGAPRLPLCLVLPPAHCLESPMGPRLCALGSSTMGGRGLPGMPRTVPDPSRGSGCPSVCPWSFARHVVRPWADGGHQCCCRVPHLTLVRETPALSPLSICFQLLIQETHVLSIYLEKNE